MFYDLFEGWLEGVLSGLKNREPKHIVVHLEGAGMHKDSE
jgi:hypothetical protein